MTTTDQATRTWTVGDRLRLEPGRITRTNLALFAGGSGDHNPIHVDLDVARDAGMSDVFAHGMLSMAYVGRLLTDNFPQTSLRSLQVRFAAITPVGVEPVCHGELVGCDGDLVTVALHVELADGTTTVAGQATLLLEGDAA